MGLIHSVQKCNKIKKNKNIKNKERKKDEVSGPCEVASNLLAKAIVIIVKLVRGEGFFFFFFRLPSVK